MPHPSSTPAPPPAFVHVDLDGLWTLAGCYGYPEGDGFERDPIYEQALDSLLELLDRLGIKATFFISGRDFDHPDKRRRIAEIASLGHELANHGWSHAIGMEGMEPEDLEREIEKTSRALEETTGQRPVGFRAPGYDGGPRILAALSRAGIRYDGSTLPTYWGPLLRWAADRLRRRVRLSGCSADELTRTKGQYGSGGSIRSQWFHPPGGGRPVLRLPLAVSPGLHLPLHASLGMLMGERVVIGGLKRLDRRTEPITYLLHGMDAADPEQLRGRIPDVLHAPRTMGRPLSDKLTFLETVLTRLKELRPITLTGHWLDQIEPPCGG
jgi:hypothetical protein